jgi:hypothetical protein
MVFVDFGVILPHFGGNFGYFQPFLYDFWPFLDDFWLFRLFWAILG